jgi:hypothetical protein
MSKDTINEEKTTRELELEAKELITHEEIRELLISMIRKYGSTKTGAKLNVSTGYLSQVMDNSAKLGPTIFQNMGYERLVLYRKVKK